MANTALSALDNLAVNSITDAGSLFMFLTNNGNARYISAANLSAQIGLPLGVTVVRSSTTAIAAFTTTTVVYQAADYDALGYWDSNTPAHVRVPYFGYIQLNACVRLSDVDATTVGTWITKNGAGFLGGGFHRQFTSGSDEFGVISAPVKVNSGDYFGHVVRANSARTLDGSAGRVYLNLQPLAIWLPS